MRRGPTSGSAAKDWDEAARADFEARLARARPHNRQQYLRIKGLSLRAAGHADGLGVSRGDRYSTGTDALTITEAEARRAVALGPAPSTETSYPSTNQARTSTAKSLRPE